MRASFLCFAILPAALFFVPQPSQAKVWYPWCSSEFGHMSPSNCYHRNKADCLATLKGLGGRCYEVSVPGDRLGKSAACVTAAVPATERR